MKFVRYVLVQLVCYAVDMGGFLFGLHVLGTTPVYANIGGRVLAAVLGYFAHRSITFGTAQQKDHASSATRYAALFAINIPISSAVLTLMLMIVPQPVVAKFISDVCCAFLTFWLSKRFVFKREQSQAVEP